MVENRRDADGTLGIIVILLLFRPFLDFFGIQVANDPLVMRFCQFSGLPMVGLGSLAN